jgi:hypothetical protein
MHPTSRERWTRDSHGGDEPTDTEDSMKHKGERHIPDFSRKAAKPGHPVVPDRQAAHAPPPVRAPQSKPPATSVKSGRRGQ